MEGWLTGYTRWMATGLFLLVVVVGGSHGQPGGSWAIPAAASPAWPAQGPLPLPAPPQVPEAVQQLERQAQQGLDQLSADAKSKVGEETSRLQATAKQEAARAAGNVVKEFTARLQQALLDLVAQVCGASPAAVLLAGLALLIGAGAGRRHP